MKIYLNSYNKRHNWIFPYDAEYGGQKGLDKFNATEKSTGFLWSSEVLHLLFGSVYVIY